MEQWQIQDHMMKKAYHNRGLATTLNTAKIYAKSHTRVPAGYAAYSNPELNMAEEEHNPKKSNRKVRRNEQSQCPKCKTHKESIQLVCYKCLQCTQCINQTICVHATPQYIESLPEKIREWVLKTRHNMQTVGATTYHTEARHPLNRAPDNLQHTQPQRPSNGTQTTQYRRRRATNTAHTIAGPPQPHKNTLPNDAAKTRQNL